MKYPTVLSTTETLFTSIICLALINFGAWASESDISCRLVGGEVICTSSVINSTASTSGRPTCNVKNAQIELSRRNFNVGAADGIWGKATSKGVRRFQKKASLEETGLLDSATCKALGVIKTCEDVMDDWTTNDMDKIAAFWGRSRADAIRIGIKPPAVIPPKGCHLRLDVEGSKVTPYCRGKPLSQNSCRNPFGVDPLS